MLGLTRERTHVEVGILCNGVDFGLCGVGVQFAYVKVGAGTDVGTGINVGVGKHIRIGTPE